MLTNREVVKRINHWAKKPWARNVPVCRHDESHGCLKAIILQGDIIMSCTQCDYKEFDYIPETAFRKVA